MDDVGELLRTWELPELIPTFADQKITLQALSALSQEDLKDLIPLAGPRVLFTRCWRTWKNEFASDIISFSGLDLTNFDQESQNYEDKDLQNMNEYIVLPIKEPEKENTSPIKNCNQIQEVESVVESQSGENADTHEKLSYKDLTKYAASLSSGLKKLGVGLGDTVALGSEKRNEFVPTALAIVFTGATYTPYDLKSGRAILKHKLNITKPKYFICTSLFWDTYGDLLKTFDCIKHFITLDEETDGLTSVKNILSNVDVESFEPARVQGQSDVAFILYSSGTTGMPKGVQLTHLNCILNSLPLDFKDAALTTAFVYGEWYHNYDTFMTYKFLAAGRNIVYINNPTLEGFLKCIEKCKVNVAMIVPSLVGFCSKADDVGQYNLDSLKLMYSRSSPLHQKTIENVKRRFPKLQNVLQGYGMTECGEPTSESWGTKGPKPGSVGMPSPGLIIKVVDPQTNEILGPNERGEIRVAGPVFMKGYIGIDPTTYLDKQGFFKTGDLGYYDDDRYFYIVDRMKEIIVYDGYKVAPLELESILLAHPKVLEVGVVGKVVPDYGEEPTAFVVKQPGADVIEQELVDYVASEVSPYMQLRGGVRFVDKIPRNTRGKVLRRNLREILNEKIHS